MKNLCNFYVGFGIYSFFMKIKSKMPSVRGNLSHLWISPLKPLGWVLSNQRHYRLRTNLHDQRKTTKTTTHIGNYAHSYTNKTYQKKKDFYIHPYSVRRLINKWQQSYVIFSIRKYATTIKRQLALQNMKQKYEYH